MNLSPQVLQAAPAASAYCIAYSGGMDSTVLLNLAVAAQLPNLSAIHVHHGLQLAADDWATGCKAQCSDWGVPLKVLHVTVDAQHPQGPEAAARAARYAALQAHMPQDAVLLTAHHAGDQAETVLLRLLRGTGVEGLAAMPITTPLGTSGLTLWRPLLRASRDALRRYAEQHALRWVEDPHNSDPQYARSWLRGNVMPLLHARWPDADVQLARAADHAADASTLLTGLAETLLPPLRRDDGLSVSGLLTLKPAERRLVLRHWLASRRLPVPFASALQQLEHDVLRAHAEAMPLLRWPGVECRRYRDVFYASAPLPPLPEEFTVTWDGSQPLQLPAGYGALQAPQGFPEPVQVRFTQGGERIRPKNDAHTRSLRYLAQQAGVPPWLRPRLPLVFAAGQLVSVAGHWNSATAMQLCWQAPDFHGLPLSWRQRFTNN